MAQAKQSAGSDKAELKKLLQLAREQAVNVAFCFGADGKAIVKMDKSKSPRSLDKLLKEEEGSRNHRFGTVLIDPANEKRAVFAVNKSGSGFARKLAAALKGTGISTVSLAAEDGSVEQAEEADDEAAPAAAPVTAESEAAPDAVDAAQLGKLAKASQVWDATFAKIVRDLDQLAIAAVKAGGGHALADGLDEQVKQAAAPLLQTLGGPIGKALAGAGAAKDPDTRNKLLAVARKEVAILASFAQSSPVVSHLDANPFAPMVIGRTLAASLAAISATIR